MFLIAKDLTVQYRSQDKYVEALKDVSFDLRQGEILGVVGESGSGKSTFALSVLNLLPSDCRKQGEIIFNNKNILSLNDRQAQKLRGNEIGLIFQDPAGTFNPVLTLGYQFEEVLTEKLSLSDRIKRKEIIFDCLSRAKLKEPERIIKSYPHQLSGGQLQRVAIAMAIALRPKLLIADEPTSSLDVTIESQIVNLFKELSRALNLTIIFITHNLDLVKVLCDRAVVLYQGRVREIRKTEELFASAQDSYTKSLLAAFKQLEE